MPIRYSRRLTGRQRTLAGNRQLGLALAFIAGATNAGAWLAVQQYTSHMTGLVSALADRVVLGQFDLAAAALGGIASFMAGAALCAVLVHVARRRRMHGEYALPLLLEALLLLVFGLVGAGLAGVHTVFFVPGTVMLLCFTMGLQNAVVSKVSHAEIRTTHMTGVITDIGIQLGRALYWNRADALPPVRTDVRRLLTLVGLLAAFLAGGMVGAVAFKRLGYSATVPLALLLVAFAAGPVRDDVVSSLRRRRRANPADAAR